MCMIYSGITKLYIIVLFLAVVHLSFSGKDQKKTEEKPLTLSNALKKILTIEQTELAEKLTILSHTKKNSVPECEHYLVEFVENGDTIQLLCCKTIKRANDFFNAENFDTYETNKKNEPNLDKNQNKRLYTLIETLHQENDAIIEEFKLVKKE